MKKFVLSLLASLCVVAYAQSQVSGTVTDPDGKPIAGVAVVVKGTNMGVVTAINGTYQVNAPKDGTLVFSYLGMKDAMVSVNGRNIINLKMEADNLNVDEVIVLGYGSGKKIGTVVGSVATVEAKELVDRPTANIMDAMQGQVAGLDIQTTSGELNATSSIRLHGQGSMGAGNSPLILLDGAPISASDLVNMNQNDIERMSVLKDASATSIYGSRAANGVLYITSKKGLRNEGPTVTLRTQYALASPLEPTMTPATTKQYLDYATTSLMALGLGVFPGDQMYDAYFNMLRNPAAGYVPAVDETKSYDWFKQLYESNQPLYQVDLSVTGGSEKTSYFFSGNYQNQEGLSIGSTFERFNFRTNIETQANKWLKTGMNLNFSYSEAENTFDSDDLGGIWWTLSGVGYVLIPPFENPYDENGDKLMLLPYGGGYPSAYGISKYFPAGSNRLSVIGGTFVELTPIKGLTVRSQLNGNVYDSRSNSKTTEYPYNNGVDSASESFGRAYSWTWTNTAEYKFNVCPKDEITVLVGQELIYNSAESFSVGMKGEMDPRFTFISYGTDLSSTPTYATSRSVFNSLFARAEWNHDNKYFIDGSIRRDESSRFGANDRDAIFYSLGARWNLKKERFLKDSDVISDMSLKVSYGTQGNAGIGDYTQYATFTRGEYDSQSGWILNNPGNPNLAWEKQGLFTVGVAAEFLGRYNVELELYNRKTSDMLLTIPISGTTGATELLQNSGSMRNRGFDLTLGANIFSNKDWNISARATLAYVDSEVTKLWSGTNESVMGTISVMKVGCTYPAFYAYEFAGVDPETGYGLWKTADGSTSPDPSLAVKKALEDKPWIAPWSGGFGFNVTWKNLTLAADFAWTKGNYKFNNVKYFSENPGFAAAFDQNISTGALDFWKEPGDKTRYPSMWYITNVLGGDAFMAQESSQLVEEASYFRMKNIQLSYTFPKNLLSKTNFLKGARVYVGGRNLWTITDYEGLDPEAGANVTMDDYPNSRQFTFGLELKF